MGGAAPARDPKLTGQIPRRSSIPRWPPRQLPRSLELDDACCALGSGRTTADSRRFSPTGRKARLIREWSPAGQAAAVGGGLCRRLRVNGQVRRRPRG
jgi:hypothetical protein